MKTLNSKKNQVQENEGLSIDLPLVSIVVPTHNRAHLIKDCLESVVNQTYENIEVVVVNDNSEDNTEDILREYETKYSFLKFYDSEGKGGNAARNLGIEKSKGEYIALMDDDDVCEFDRVEHQMEILISSHFSYDFIVSSYYVITPEGKKTTSYKKPLESVGYPQRWLIKREKLIEIGGFDVEQPAMQDVECYWRLKRNSKIYFDSTPVVNIRATPVSITRDNTKMIKGIKRLLDLHGNQMSQYEKKIWIITLCKKYAANGEWNNYHNYLKNLSPIKAPFSTVFLYSSYILRNNRLLALHSKMFDKYSRYKDRFLSIY